MDFISTNIILYVININSYKSNNLVKFLLHNIKLQEQNKMLIVSIQIVGFVWDGGKSPLYGRELILNIRRGMYIYILIVKIMWDNIWARHKTTKL